MTPVALPVRDWFRAAREPRARPDYVPRPDTVTRFNDGVGAYAVLYYAADAVTALLEARALFGYPHTSETAATHDKWRVFRYRINLGREATVVNLGNPRERSAANTNTQELTGDWEGRRLALGRRRGIAHVQHGTAPVPTQRLAGSLYEQWPHLVGLVAPSARMPTLANLALFVSRIPLGSVELNGSTVIVV